MTQHYQTQFDKKMAGVISKVSVAYGVSPAMVREQFAVSPQMDVRLNLDIANRHAFLKMCNVIARRDQTGGSFLIGGHGRNTKTNNTAAGDARRPGNPLDWRENLYQMYKAHSDFKIHDDLKYEWSQFPNFEQMYRQAFQTGIANDRVMIGWHGTSYEVTSDLTTHPLMQDVNVGWFQQLKNRAPEHFITEGNNPGEIRIGVAAGDDYPNLDLLIHDLHKSIPVHKRTGLVAVVGSSILAGAQGRLFETQGETPTEKEKILSSGVIGTYGGLPTIEADFFPENAVMVTRLKRPGVVMSNLSIYYQAGSWKRHIEYKPELEAVIDWNKRHECYHIEDLEAIRVLQADTVTFTGSGLVIAPTDADYIDGHS